MSQIKLTPEELRISAQKYTTGSQSITDVLTVLTQEQAVIDENWDGTAFDSFEAQFNELSPKITQFAQLFRRYKSTIIESCGCCRTNRLRYCLTN